MVSLRGLLPLVLLALARPAGAAPAWRAGADAGILLRDGGYGGYVPQPLVGVRLALDLHPNLAASLAYRFSFHSEGSTLQVRSQHHQLLLRPELRLPLATATLLVAAGPALEFGHTTLLDRGQEAVSSSTARLGVSGGLALDVRLASMVLRAGVDLSLVSRRLGVGLVLGAAFDLAGEVRR